MAIRSELSGYLWPDPAFRAVIECDRCGASRTMLASSPELAEHYAICERPPWRVLRSKDGVGRHACPACSGPR